MKEFGEEDKEGFTTYPFGIVISLPSCLCLKDGEAQPTRINGLPATLLLYKQTRDENFYKQRIFFPLDPDNSYEKGRTPPLYCLRMH